MTIADFSLAKIRQEQDCTKLDAGQLLRLAMDDIETGVYQNPAIAIVVLTDKLPDGSQEISSYRCGLNRAEEIGYLHMAIQKALDGWVK